MQSLELKDIDTKDDLDTNSKHKVSSSNNPPPPAPKKIHSDAFHSQPKMQEAAHAPQPGARLGQLHQTVASNVSYGQTSMSVTETA
jgi:hypothetical protein